MPQTRLYLILAIFLAASSSPSQEISQRLDKNPIYDSTYEIQLNAFYPTYYINFHLESGRNPSGEPVGILLITTSYGQGRIVLDTLRDYIKGLGDPDLFRKLLESDEGEPHFVDVNFDGFLDIRFPVDRSMSGGVEYNYYLFDSVHHKFEFSEEFTDACMGAQIDEKNKQIVTTSMTERDCGYCWEESHYKVDHNHPILFQVITSELVDSGGVSKQKITTRQKKNGKLAVVKIEYGDVVH